MAWKGLTLTTAGRNLLTDAQVGKKLNFKSVVIGDGKEPANYNTRTALVNQLFEITALTVETTENGVEVTAELPAATADGYFFREVGIIATSDSGNVLYAYDNCGDDAAFVDKTTEKRLRLVLTISSDINVTVTTSSLLYVDQPTYNKDMAAVNAEIKLLQSTKATVKNMTERLYRVQVRADGWTQGTNGTYTQTASEAYDQTFLPGKYELVKFPLDLSTPAADIKNYNKTFSTIANGTMSVSENGKTVELVALKPTTIDTLVCLMWRGVMQ